MSALVSKETGRRVFTAGVVIEVVMLLKFAAMPPKNGRDLCTVLGEGETVSPAHRRLYYLFTAVLGSARLACLAKTPTSFPLWALTLWIHIMELVYFNTQARELKKTQPLDAEQKSFLYIIWILPLVQLLTRDFQ